MVVNQTRHRIFFFKLCLNLFADHKFKPELLFLVVKFTQFTKSAKR